MKNPFDLLIVLLFVPSSVAASESSAIPSRPRVVYLCTETYEQQVAKIAGLELAIKQYEADLAKERTPKGEKIVSILSAELAASEAIFASHSASSERDRTIENRQCVVWVEEDGDGVL